MYSIVASGLALLQRTTHTCSEGQKHIDRYVRPGRECHLRIFSLPRLLCGTTTANSLISSSATLVDKVSASSMCIKPTFSREHSFSQSTAESASHIPSLAVNFIPPLQEAAPACYKFRYTPCTPDATSQVRRILSASIHEYILVRL